jgi:hypothetical protein
MGITMNAIEARKMTAKYEANTHAKYMAEQRKRAAAIKKIQDEFDVNYALFQSRIFKFINLLCSRYVNK